MSIVVSSQPIGPETLIQMIDDLRDQWALQAHGIERIMGDSNLAAKTLRCCIGDAHGLIETIKEKQKEIHEPKR